MYKKLADKKTSKGFTLDYAIRCGVVLPHVGVGIVNDGIESLNLYKDIYDPVIEAWHGFKPTQKHGSNMNSKDIKAFSIDQKTVNK